MEEGNRLDNQLIGSDMGAAEDPSILRKINPSQGLGSEDDIFEEAAKHADYYFKQDSFNRDSFT
jgi:hypothetical protein